MWSIHNKCNYQCSYCPEELHNGTLQWLSLEVLKGFVDKIENHYIKVLGHKNILFSFTGGEPTLWKDFKIFVNYIHQKGFKSGLTSNNSVSEVFWKVCLLFQLQAILHVRGLIFWIIGTVFFFLFQLAKFRDYRM